MYRGFPSRQLLSGAKLAIDMLLPVILVLLVPASAWQCFEDKHCPADSTCCKGYCKKRIHQVCPKNMHYEACGSSCQPSCVDPEPKECDKTCHPGCVCDAGFVLDGLWHCIKIDRCPTYTATCGHDASLTKCGDPCEPTCKNKNPKGGPKYCLRNVCQCNPGFYRHPKKGCIDSNECQCENEEEFKPCVDKKVPCEATCENPSPLADCTERCFSNIANGVCRCQKGLVRHKARGCIPEDKCNKRVCGKHEHYSSCGSACEPSCENPHPVTCPQKCIEDVCECDAGYYRHETRGCIRKEHCRLAICGKNEHFTLCGSTSEPSCENPVPQLRTGGCLHNVCQCNAGFFRHKKNGCVTLAECGSAVCGPNEFFTRCGSACEPTCENPFPKICTDQCVVNACQCKKDFFRNIEKKCVPLSECPVHESVLLNKEEKSCRSSKQPEIEYVAPPRRHGDGKAVVYGSKGLYYDPKTRAKYLIDQYMYV